jgi:Multisubunit Na+/H+ antiporter, MnhE subunit
MTARPPGDGNGDRRGPAPPGPPGRAGERPPLSRRDKRRNRIIAVIGLVAVWCLLWGSFSWANLIGGLVLAVVVLVAFPLPPVTFAGRVHLPGLVRFVARFLRDLVVSSVQVAALAFRFGHVPRSAIIAVPLRIRSDLNLTLTAVALCLVPGSLVVEVDRAAGVLYVHALGVRDAEQVERFRRDVLALEARIVGAIGSRAERRVIAESAGTGPAAP